MELKDKFAVQQPSTATDLIGVTKEVWVKGMSKYYTRPTALSNPKYAKVSEGSDQERWRTYKALNLQSTVIQRLMYMNTSLR